GSLGLPAAKRPRLFRYSPPAPRFSSVNPRVSLGGGGGGACNAAKFCCAEVVARLSSSGISRVVVESANDRFAVSLRNGFIARVPRSRRIAEIANAPITAKIAKAAASEPH